MIAMGIYFPIICVVFATVQNVFAQNNIHALHHKQQKKKNLNHDFPDFNHSMLLETKSDTTANVSFGDFNGDGHLDIFISERKALAYR